MLDKFRTLNWKEIEEELSIFETIFPKLKLITSEL